MSIIDSILRSLPDSPMERAQAILGFQGSTGVLSCTSTPETPTIQPPTKFSVQVINNNEAVTRFPTYIKMGTPLRTDIKVSDSKFALLYHKLNYR